MALKKFNPTTPSRRQMTMSTFKEATTNAPEKSLLVSLKKTGSRDAQGETTVRHHSGRTKRKYRIIDFKRDKDGIPTKVATVEYDPNRSAYITLVVYTDEERRYILAPISLEVGDTVVSGSEVNIKPGNALQLKHMPVGILVHNIELQAGEGGQMVRSTGTSAQLMAKEGNYAILRLPSGGMRYVGIECKVIVGTISSTTYKTVNIGEADRKRHMRWRPTVRGSVMSPCDHPHGDGKDRFPINRPNPVTPWNKPALRYKTRKNKEYSDRLIVKRRDAK